MSGIPNPAHGVSLVPNAALARKIRTVALLTAAGVMPAQKTRTRSLRTSPHANLARSALGIRSARVAAAPKAKVNASHATIILRRITVSTSRVTSSALLRQ